MKKDKYEQLKPEVFNFEDNFTPTLKNGEIAAIFAMMGLLFLFVWLVIELS